MTFAATLTLPLLMAGLGLAGAAAAADERPAPRPPAGSSAQPAVHRVVIIGRRASAPERQALAQAPAVPPAPAPAIGSQRPAAAGSAVR